MNRPRRLVRVLVVLAALASLGVTMCMRYEPPREPEPRIVTPARDVPPPKPKPQPQWRRDRGFSSSKSPGEMY